MLESDFHIDLPDAEDTRRPSLLDRLFASRAPTPKRVLVAAPADVVDGIARAVSGQGMTNVLTAVANHELVYLDERGDSADLDAARRAIATSGVLEPAVFQQMRLILDHRHEGLHLTADIEVRTPVPAGTEEMHVHLSGKIAELQARKGESARSYADRIRAFAADPSLISRYRNIADALTSDLAAAFGRELGHLTPRIEPAWVRVVQVQIAQMGAFRDLSWRDDVAEPRYRPVPKFMERGVFSDPFLYFYYDPYFDYLNWNLLDALLYEGAWRSRHVRVVEAGGTLLFNGEQAASRGRHSTGTMETVGWDSSGNLRIGSQVPRPPRSGDPFGGPVDWEPGAPKRG